MSLRTPQFGLYLILTVNSVSLLPGPAGASPAGAIALDLVRVFPEHASVASTAMVEVTLRNAGETALSDGGGLHLEAIWRGPGGVPFHDWTADERSRYGFGDSVEPGGTFTVRIPLRAVVGGRHTLTLDLVRSGEKASLQTLTAEVIARGRATVWSVGMAGMLALAAVASRCAKRLPSAVHLAISFLPLLAVWAAAVITQKMFSELTGLPLHDMAMRLIYGASALYVLPVMLFPARYRNAASAVAVGALTLLAYADAVHQRAFGSIVSVASLSSAGQLLSVRDSVIEFTHASDMPLLVVLSSAIILPFFRHAPEQRRSIDRIGRIGRIACLAIIIVFAWPVPGQIDRMVKGFFGLNVYNPGAIVARLGLHSAHFFDMRRAWRERTFAAKSPRLI